MVFGREKKLYKSLENFLSVQNSVLKETEDSKMELFVLFHLVRGQRTVAGYAFVILFVYILGGYVLITRSVIQQTGIKINSINSQNNIVKLLLKH